MDDVDYEMDDGSTFSLRAVWSRENGNSVFQYTNISAQVDGQAYTGKLLRHSDEVDDVDVLAALRPVPHGCVHPRFPNDFTEFVFEATHDVSQFYFKSPSFTFDDCQPGNTFVADCVLHEASVLERLKAHPHKNLPSYAGCLVKDDCITHLCFDRYPHSLQEYASRGLSRTEKVRILNGVQAAIQHLHSLGLAHNDVNADNVCISWSGEPVLIDFDACLRFGEKLLKGMDYEAGSNVEAASSRASNDWHGLEQIEQFLDKSVDEDSRPVHAT